MQLDERVDDNIQRLVINWRRSSKAEWKSIEPGECALCGSSPRASRATNGKSSAMKHNFGDVKVIRIGERETVNKETGEPIPGPFVWEIQCERGALSGVDRDFDAALRVVRQLLRF